MNSEQDKAIAFRQEEMRRLGGEDAYRRHALNHLKLKTVVKESHCSAVHALAFNHMQPELHNLFATVGKDQATVYDDEHMADYLGVVVHFSNQKTEHAEGGELQVCCWLSAEGWTAHPHGDACLAVSGADANISIVSVVEARVIKLLKGHSKDVTDLAGCTGRPGLLVSLSRDGNVRAWDLPSEQCLFSLATDALCLALSPDGSSFVTGNSKGQLHRYELDWGSGSGSAGPVADPSKRELRPQGSGHSEAVDCLRFLPGGRLASKSGEGRMFVWDLASMAAAASWKVPSCNPVGGFQSRCQFGSTPDGQFICVGNTVGDCYVYDAASGQRVAHASPIKVTGPVRSCGLSADCRHLCAVVGKGFVFRFEYLGEQQQQAAEEGKAGEVAGEGEQPQAAVAAQPSGSA